LNQIELTCEQFVNNFWQRRNSKMIMIEEMVGGGTGLYTLGEAAKYARMHQATLTRWFKGDGYCERVIPLENAKVITFLDFVQALAIRNLRVLYKIPLQDIRDAVDRAVKDHGITHPFAYKHTTFLFEKKIWIQPEGKDLIQISGKGHGQTGLTPIIENFYKDISFDAETGFASSYKAYERTYASGSHKIVMNPKVRFGEPILDNSGYTPEALFEAAKIEGSVEEAARNYDVGVDQIRICIDYFDYLSGSAN
jgi:uncharacterized protein (DUF433 family)